MSLESSSSTSEFTTGLAILLFAQLLSAYMGAFVEDTYTMYNASWTENLFYSHIFSLPLFLPLSGNLQKQYARLSTTSPLKLRDTLLSPEHKQPLLETLPPGSLEAFCNLADSVPQGLLFLFTNSITQLACISGVNLLSAKSSAVTVTIVLNIRKLVSFIFSTLLFGHTLSSKMILGSTLVFGSGALYGWETTYRLPMSRRKQAAMNGSAKAEGSTITNGSSKKISK